MVIWRCGYRIAACLAIAPLVACGDPEIFDRIGGPSDPNVAKTSWPKLAEIPEAPPLGVYSPAIPDPAIGEATQIELAVEAEIAETRRKAVEGPVE